MIMKKNNTIFITGGAGFIANKLIAKLIDSNKIVVYDNFSRDTLSKSKYINHKNIKIIKGDILNFELLKTSISRSNIIIHTAAIAGIDTVLKDPVKTMKVNMIGTANVLEAARINQVSEKFIEFSTSEIFGNYAFKSDENSNAVAGSAGEARWSYAVSKLAGEHLAMAYYRQFGLPTVSVRPFNIYGSGQTGDSAMLKFITNALKNEDINIYGDGNQIRAWCYIDDFVDCVIKIINNKKAIGQSFNIGNSKAIMTIYGLAQTVCRVLNSKSNILFQPPLSADVELRIPSTEKAKKILNFKAKIDIDEGIKLTSEWVKENLSND
tara:strand:+ start:3880 stop:4848 length:969 start_codon:yes stop_codon:yes gene_type:complete